MNIAPWVDTPFDDADAFGDFQMVHGLAHDDIASVMYQLNNVYTTYPLMDATTENKDWLLTHQQEHASIYALLGLTGLPDLATVDLRKDDEYTDWLNLHNQIHTVINATLGITS